MRICFSFIPLSLQEMAAEGVQRWMTAVSTSRLNRSNHSKVFPNQAHTGLMLLFQALIVSSAYSKSLEAYCYRGKEGTKFREQSQTAAKLQSCAKPLLAFRRSHSPISQRNTQRDFRKRTHDLKKKIAFDLKLRKPNEVQRTRLCYV